MMQKMQEDKRRHLVKCDYGVNDYFRFFKKNYKHSNITRQEFGEIIKRMNGQIRDDISTKGASFIFPLRIGTAELRKTKTEVKIGDDGEIINNLPTNWKETRKLWATNPDAKEKGIKIKFTNEHSDGYTFKVTYLRAKATFRNKSIYKMRFNRELKRNLSTSIFEGRIDAFINMI